MGILRYFFYFLLFIFPIAEVGKINIGFFSFSINDFFVLIFLVLLITKYKQILRSNLFKPIAIFVALAALSLLINLQNYSLQNSLVAFLYIVRWVSYSGLYFALSMENKENIQKIKTFLLLPISLFIIFGALQFIFYQNLRNLFYLGWDEHLYRLFSTFFDPNFAAAFLCICFLFLFDYSRHFFNTKKYFLLAITFFMTILSFVEIFLTYSRSGLIMLAIGIISYLILSKKVKLLFLILFLFLITLIFSPKSFSTEGTNIFRIASSEARIQSAELATTIIQKNPIFGVGFNAYRYTLRKYGYLKGDNWQSTHAGAGTDNSFLFVWATAGILGLLSYIFLLYKMFYLAQGKFKQNKFSIVFVSILIAVIIDSLFINSLFYVYIMEFVWIFAAITERS